MLQSIKNWFKALWSDLKTRIGVKATPVASPSTAAPVAPPDKPQSTVTIPNTDRSIDKVTAAYLGVSEETSKILDSRVGQGSNTKIGHEPNLVAEGVWEEANYPANGTYTWYVTVPEGFNAIQLKILDAPGRIMTACKVSVTDDKGTILVSEQDANPTGFALNFGVFPGEKLCFNVWSDKGGPGRAQFNRG